MALTNDERTCERALVAVCLIAATILSFSCVSSHLQGSASERENKTTGAADGSTQSVEIARIAARFEDEKVKTILSGQTYTLAHVALREESRKAVAVIGISESGVTSISVKAAIERAGGAEAYRQKVAALLKDDEVMVRGFAAVWLGVLGDKKSVPNLLNLLRSHELPVRQRFLAGEDRERAAIGLGLLGATECAPELSTLLQSSNANVRSGAALGLGYMKATDYADAVAKLLTNQKETDDVLIGAVCALAEMGAKSHAAELASLLTSVHGGDPGVWQAIFYALARLKATRQAKDIASFLGDEFKKGDAAEALALMNAQEYASQIAAILSDMEPLNRSAALLALGILRAKQFEAQVAKHLVDPEEFVRPYAAWALIMMESEKYARDTMKVAARSQGVLSIEGQGVKQIAVEDFRQVFDRAQVSYKKLRARERLRKNGP